MYWELACMWGEFMCCVRGPQQSPSARIVDEKKMNDTKDEITFIDSNTCCRTPIHSFIARINFHFLHPPTTDSESCSKTWFRPTHIHRVRLTLRRTNDSFESWWLERHARTRTPIRACGKWPILMLLLADARVSQCRWAVAFQHPAIGLVSGCRVEVEGGHVCAGRAGSLRPQSHYANA